MTITLVCCMDKNRAIGYKNSLLAHLPSDLKHFREVTTSGKQNICVMGKNTHISIGRSLPNRINVVLTRNKKYKAPSDVFVYHSIEEVLKHYKGNEDVDMFVIGGQTLYEQMIQYADKLELTIVDHEFSKTDTWFPEFDLSDWKVTSNIKNEADEKNPYDYYFVSYVRRK